MEERRLQEMCGGSKKGGEEMSQSPGPRIISKLVEGISIKCDISEDPPFSIISSGQGSTNASNWVLADATQGIIQWRGYIDLSGYRGDNDFVFSPQMVALQWGGNMYGIGASLGAIPGDIHMQAAITTDKIDDLDYGLTGVAEPLCGFMGDNSEMEQVVYSTSQAWGPASTSLAMVNLQEHNFGDGPPIVSDRLYIAIRAAFTPPVVSGSQTDGTWYIPPMRFVLVGEASEIPDFQMLHLMKRQIDLQQTPDVDL